MDYIHKLPFISGALAAVVMGLICYRYGLTQQETFLRMAICMVVFYVLGVYCKKTFLNIRLEIEKKKEKEKMEELEKLKEQAIESAKTASGKKDEAGAHKIDYTAGDYDEVFSPLNVSKAISTNLDSNKNME